MAFDIAKHRAVWSKNFETEILYWHKVIRKMSKQSFVDREMDSNMFLHMFVKSHDVSILDVGAGPLTAVGELFKGYPIKEVFCADTLANIYNKVMDEHKVEFRHRGVKLNLSDDDEVDVVLDGKYFDIAHALNSIDHSYDPINSIRNMLRHLKDKGVAVIEVALGSGCGEEYCGLHQWSFDVDSHHGIMISDGSGEVAYLNNIVKETFKDSPTVDMKIEYTTTDRKRDGIHSSKVLCIAIFKNYSDVEVAEYVNLIEQYAIQHHS